MRNSCQQSARATYARLRALLLLPLLAFAGCSSSPSSTNVTNATSITINPLYNPQVGTGEQVQITGSSYTKSATTFGLTWMMTCTGATGAGCGTLSNPTSSFVTYVAPLTISVPSLSVTVTATSVVDPTVSTSYTFSVITTVFTITPVGPVTVKPGSSITVTTTLNPDPGLTNTNFAETGPGCAASSCGVVTVVAGMNGKNYTYTAPSTAAPLPVSLQLTPAADTNISQTLFINVAPPNVGLLQFTPAILPPANAGGTYSQTLTVSGGTPPYVVDIPTTSVPAWVTSLTPGGNPNVTTVSKGTITYYEQTTNGLILIAGTAPVSNVSINPTTGATLPVVTADLPFTVQDSASSPTFSANGIGLDVYTAQNPTMNNALLKGTYVFSGLGFQDGAATVNAERTGYIGQFTADGNGNITAGYMDVNETGASYSVPILGNYVVYPSQTGFMTIQNAGNTPGPIAFAITLGSIGGDGAATTGAFVEYDDEIGNGAATIPATGNKCCGGTRAQGPILKQAASVISAVTNPLVGSYAFAMNGRNPYAYIAPGATNAACNVITATAIPSCGPVAAAGSVTFGAAGAITAGEQDITQGQVTNSQVGIGGTGLNTFGKTDAYGRATANITATTGATGLIDWPSNYVVYEVNPTTFFAMSTDPYSTSTLLEGEGMQQNLADITSLPFSGTHNVVVFGDSTNSQNFFVGTSTILGGEATATQQLLTVAPNTPATSGSMSGSQYVQYGGQPSGFSSPQSPGVTTPTAGGTAYDVIPSFTYSVDTFGRVTNNSAPIGPGAGASTNPAPNQVGIPNLYLTDTDTGFGIATGISGAGIYVMQQQTITSPTALSAGTYSWTNSFPNSQTAPLQAGSITIPTGGVPNSASGSTNVNITGQAYQSYFSTTYDEGDGGPLLFGTAITGTMSVKNSQLTGFSVTSGIQGCSGFGIVVTPQEFLCFPNATGYTSVQVFQQ